MTKTLLIVIALSPFVFSQTKITYPRPPVGCTTPKYYPDPAVCSPPSSSPTDSLPLPAVGGTFVDATFGSRIRLLSRQGTTHGYSTPSPFSASGKYLAVVERGEQVNVLDVVTAKVLFRSRPGNITADTIRWDAVDDDVYYWLAGTKVMRHRLSVNRTDVVIDHAAEIITGGTGDTSKDNWLAFYAPSKHEVCALDLLSKDTYCTNYKAPEVVSRVSMDANVDYVLMSKSIDKVSKKRYVMVMVWPAIAVFSVDTANKRLRFEYRGPELPPDFQGARGNGDGVCDRDEKCFDNYHADTMEDVDGQQYIVASADIETPCARMLSTFRLNAGVKLAISTAAGGGRTSGFMIHGCGGFPHEKWVGNHIGCAKKAPYCALSTGGPAVATLNTASTYSVSTHLGEVMIMQGNLVEVKRLALHRSIGWSADPAAAYWATPRAALSSDGRLVMWDSNFGRTRGSYVAVADTGFALVAPAPRLGVVNR